MWKMSEAKKNYINPAVLVKWQTELAMLLIWVLDITAWEDVKERALLFGQNWCRAPKLSTEC